MESNLLIDVMGWVGVAGLRAYVLVSTKRIEGNSAPYQVLNLLGAAFLIVNSFYHGPTHRSASTWCGSASPSTL